MGHQPFVFLARRRETAMGGLVLYRYPKLHDGQVGYWVQALTGDSETGGIQMKPTKKEDAMRLIKFAVIVMSVVLCQACASEQQQAKPSGTVPAASRPSAAASKQRTETTNMQILLDKVKADKKLLVAKTWILRMPNPQSSGRCTRSINGSWISSINASRHDHGLCERLPQGPIPNESAARSWTKP